MLFSLTILSVIIFPLIGFMLKFNTKVVKVEDELIYNKKLNDVLFKKLDKFNDTLIEVGKELHHLVKMQEIDKK